MSSVHYITLNGINVSGAVGIIPKDFANTNFAIHCTAASWTVAPNVGNWAAIENSNHIIVENAAFAYDVGYIGFEVDSRYLASGLPWLTNPNSALVGTAQYITIQNDSFDHHGDLLERSTTCGDMLDFNGGVNSAGPGAVLDHMLVQNSKFTHASHEELSSEANYSVIQNNVFNADWSDLFPPLFDGVNAGYRVGEIQGSYNIIQGNLMGPSGCCTFNGSLLPPIWNQHGDYNLFRRNVLFKAAGKALSSDCGYANTIKDVRFNHIAHNTIWMANSYAIWEHAYSSTVSGTACANFGFHVFINNILYNNRQNWQVETQAGQLTVDTDILHDVNDASLPDINVGNGPIGNSSYISNLFAPSLTLPTPVATRPANFTNYANAGQQPICLTIANTTACPNTATAEATFPTYIFGSNIDAGANPTLRPTFVSSAPAAYADFTLTSSSSGVNQGASLTTATSAGTSVTSIPVADAYFFTAGLGLIAGDTIQLVTHGTQTTITNITYGSGLAGTLTVSPAVTMNLNEGIAYPFSGTAPDIGAIEISTGGGGGGTGGGGPPAIQPKSWSIATCPSDGKLYSDPTRCH